MEDDEETGGGCFSYIVAHRIHVWYIYQHLVNVYGKCRQIYHTWILWVVLLLHFVSTYGCSAKCSCNEELRMVIKMRSGECESRTEKANKHIMSHTCNTSESCEAQNFLA